MLSLDEKEGFLSILTRKRGGIKYRERGIV